MTDKELYLKKYEFLNNKITRLLDQKEQYETVAYKVTPTLSDMPSGGNEENTREDAICKSIDCDCEINLLIDELNDLRRAVRQYILKTGIEDRELIEILRVEGEKVHYI